MNRLSDIRDLLRLWADDVRAFEEQGRLDRFLSDDLQRLSYQVFCMLVHFGGIGISKLVEDPLKPKSPVRYEPKVKKIKKAVADRVRSTENENKVKTEGVKNEPKQPELPLKWAM